MYANIGGKIKGLATFIFVMGVICSLVFGAIIGSVLMSDSGVGMLIGILVMVMGSVLSWLSTLLLRGFGQLVEDNELMREQISRHKNTTKQSVVTTSDVQDLSNTGFCTNCGAVRNSSAVFCTNCGHKF